MTERTSNAGGAGRPAGDIPVEYVRIHGHLVGFRRAGSGPVVLLLHGIAGSSQSWVPTMSELQDDFTLVAPDFVGHGTSGKPSGDYSLGNLASWTRDLLEILGVERVTVVGHSYGGGVALQFAYQFPERCERLILVDSGGLGREVTWVLRLATLPGVEAVMPLLFTPALAALGDFVAGTLRRVGLHNPGVAEAWQSVRSLTDPETRRAFLRATRSVIEPGGQAIGAKERLYLAEKLPVLVVWGERDRVIPLSHALDAYDALAHCRLEILPGVGHSPHVAAPTFFADVVRDFIRTTEPRTHSPEADRGLLRRGPIAPVTREGSAPNRSSRVRRSRPERRRAGSPAAR